MGELRGCQEETPDSTEIWHNCKMTSFFFDRSVDGSPCEVKIGEKNIVVSYKEDGRTKAVIYSGKIEDDHGHYELSRKDDVDGRASLHRFKGGKFLEGWWKEDGAEGMWRITLIR